MQLYSVTLLVVLEEGLDQMFDAVSLKLRVVCAVEAWDSYSRVLLPPRLPVFVSLEGEEGDPGLRKA